MANQILYGFHNLQDLANERVTTVGIDTVTAAVEQSVAEHNRQMDALMNFFVRRTTEFQTRFISATGARLQPLDNAGRARPIKPSGYYDIGLPIQMAGTAWGADFVTRAKMTVAEAQRATSTLIEADTRWMRDHLLAAIFTDADWTFVDEQHGSLTVKALANGDSQVYQVITGADMGATADHFLATASAIADVTNPFPAIKTALMKHPVNGGQVVAFVSPTLSTTIKALANFVETADANLNVGVNTTTLSGTLGEAVPGELIGYVDGVWVVEWRSMPDDYLIATTTEGERPVAMREDEEPELRGFLLAADRNDHPWYERQYIRRAGFGAWNRAGALVYRFGNGTYAIPTGYDSPMA